MLGQGGTIVPDSVETVNYGDNVTFTITPSIGYVVADVIVDGVSQGSINSYTFTNVQSNHEIAATFSTVTKQADLYINSWSSKNNPRVGEIFTITFKVGNRGPDTAKNVVLTLPLPSGVEYVDVNVDQGTTSYDPATRTITWTLDDVVVGDPYAWVQVKALNQGSFIFQPTLTTDTFDPNIESNIQVLPVNVLAKEGGSSGTGGSSETVHAKTVGMQKTGAPIAGIVLAILMVLGGLISTSKNNK